MADTLPPTLLPPTLDAGTSPERAPAGAAPVEYQLVHTLNAAYNICFNATTEVSIGRDKEVCQLCFPECAVMSRRHARVFSLGRDVFLHDHSSNGTFLNGKVLGKDTRRALRHGDVLAVVNPKLPEYASFSWRFVSPFPDESDVPAADDPVSQAYIVGKVLGTGNFAAVHLGTSRTTGEQVAIKIVEKKRFAMQSDFSFASMQSEVEILRRMNHPNIIRVLDVFDTPKAFTLVLELVQGGDMFDYVVGRSPNPFSEVEAKVLFVQLVEALLYMHSKDVVHRDLKPENILVHVNPGLQIPGKSADHQANAPKIPVTEVTLKVTDFGLAKFCSEQDVMTTMCGTPSYLAPEVRLPGADGHRARGYSWSVDVWSLGVILYILISGVPPKSPETGIVTFGKQFTQVSTAVKNLIQAMLQVDPRARAGLNEIVNHPWLAGMHIRGRELAHKKDQLQMAATMMIQPSPTVMAAPVLEKLEGNDTDVEADDDEPANPADMAPPSAKKRDRDAPGSATPMVVVWEWKASLDKKDDDATAWKRYPQSDIDYIEASQTKGVRTAKVGNGEYRVSFEGMFQYNKLDSSKQRPIRRRLVPAGEASPAAGRTPEQPRAA